MSERLERLQREIAAERAAVLAELGLAFDGWLLVIGGQTPDEVIDRRLERVPAELHPEARTQMLRQVVRLPWLTGRRLQSQEVSA